MTVIFGQPTAGQNFGYGCRYTVRSDLVGPVSGAHWLVSLSLVSGSLGSYQEGFVPANFNVFSFRTLGAPTGVGIAFGPVLANELSASSAFLVAQLLDSSNSLVEQGQVSFTLDWRALPAIISAQLVQGVLINSNATDISAIKAAVVRSYLI